MQNRGPWRAARCSWTVITSLLLASVCEAQAPGAKGAATGDGSTTFTGLAQAPEANLFVGASTTAIAIDLPGNRAKLTPQLALRYNSSGGASPYGYGWDLPLGRIQRCGKFGVLSCGDPTHREEFVLSLPDGKVECTRNPSDNRCYPNIEESFLKIVYSPSGKKWDVWDRSGIRYTFCSASVET